VFLHVLTVGVPAMEIVFRGALASVLVLAVSGTPATAAEKCTQTSSPIETDRPDVTNSSVVIPVGSFQIENGANLSRSGGSPDFRWKLTAAYDSALRRAWKCCSICRVYVSAFRGPGPSGFTSVAPGLKWQISPIAGKFDLSITIGAGLPTGAIAIAGSGVRPYLQFPWSVELGSGWAVTGMVTNFFAPDDPVNRYTNQSTLVLERQFGEQAFLFRRICG